MVVQTKERQRNHGEPRLSKDRAALDEIDKAVHAVLYQNYNGGINQMSTIANSLINGGTKCVKHEAAMALYFILNETSNSAALDRVVKEFTKAFAEGDDYTKSAAIKYVKMILMNAENPNALKGLNSHTIDDIEGKRRMGGKIIQNLFEIDDSMTIQITNSILLRLARSPNPNLRDIFNNIIKPYAFGVGPSDAKRKTAYDGKFARLQKRAKTIYAQSMQSMIRD